MSLFEELKRRRVIRLIAAYVVVAWVIIQVVTAIEEPLNLPDWFDTFIIVLLGVGFPIAVIMSWVYDVTPEGIIKDGETAERIPLAPRIDYGKIALVAVLLLSAFLGGAFLSSRPDEIAVTAPTRAGLQKFEFGVQSGKGAELTETGNVAISADGNNVYFASGQPPNRRLLRRQISSLDFAHIAGSEETDSKFALSPDGQSLVFKRGTDQLFKVSTSGGVPVDLGFVTGQIFQFSWSEDGSILFDNEQHDGLMRIAATGGPIEELSFPEEGDSHKHPFPVPGTGNLAFVVGERAFAYDGNDRIAILTADGQVSMTGLRGATPKVSRDGHIIYFHDGALWAAKFDLETLSVDGEPQPIVDNISYGYTAHFDISAEGSLVYRRRSPRGGQSLVWVDRNGNEEPTGIEGATYNFPAVSPDGELVAVTVSSPYGIDLWTYSLSRGTPTRLTAEETRETGPVWAPGGDYIYFEAGASSDMYVISRNGVGGARAISVSRKNQWPWSLTPDGSLLLVGEGTANTAGRFDIGLFDLAENRMIDYPVRTEFWDSDPMLSPDGSLLAYVSSVSGAQQIHVVPFPDTETGAVQVSVNGVRHPQWSGDGSELFYWGADAIMKVDINVEGGLTADPPVRLFSHTPYLFDAVGSFDYDPTRDRFIMVKKPLPGSADDEIVLIQNWQELLNNSAVTP